MAEHGNMIDLGRKPTPVKEAPEKKIYYPTMSLPVGILGNKDYDLEEEVTIIAKGKVMGIEKTYHREGKGEVRIELHQAGLQGKKKGLSEKLTRAFEKKEK